GSIARMQNLAALVFNHFTHVKRSAIGFQNAGIEELAAASGIERGLIENDGRTPVALDELLNLGSELVQESVVIREPLGHCRSDEKTHHRSICSDHDDHSYGRLILTVLVAPVLTVDVMLLPAKPVVEAVTV